MVVICLAPKLFVSISKPGKTSTGRPRLFDCGHAPAIICHWETLLSLFHAVPSPATAALPNIVLFRYLEPINTPKPLSPVFHCHFMDDSGGAFMVLGTVLT